MRDTPQNRTDIAIKTTWVGFFWNVVLTISKFAAAILGHSAAMMADAVHSLTDFITDLVVLVGFSFVKKPADANHDYGHGKVETLCTTIIGMVLVFAGVKIFASGVSSIYYASMGQKILRPGFVALAAALVSLLVKEILYRYTKSKGEQIESEAVIANAWHHRSDMFSSMGTALGIAGAILLGEKWRILDPLAAIIVSFFIVKVAFEIIITSIHDLLEGSLSDSTEKDILHIINSTKGVKFPHNLRTRKIGNAIAIDVHIMVDQELSIVEAHDIATEVETQLRKCYGTGTFISVHMEPDSTERI